MMLLWYCSGTARALLDVVGFKTRGQVFKGREGRKEGRKVEVLAGDLLIFANRT